MLDLPRCYEAPASGGCGCGCSGGSFTSALAALPWWVWLAAFGVYAALSGDERVAAVAFGPKRTRARGRRR